MVEVSDYKNSVKKEEECRDAIEGEKYGSKENQKQQCLSTENPNMKLTDSFLTEGSTTTKVKIEKICTKETSEECDNNIINNVINNDNIDSNRVEERTSTNYVNISNQDINSFDLLLEIDRALSRKVGTGIWTETGTGTGPGSNVESLIRRDVRMESMVGSLIRTESSLEVMDEVVKEVQEISIMERIMIVDDGRIREERFTGEEIIIGVEEEEDINSIGIDTMGIIEDRIKEEMTEDKTKLNITIREEVVEEEEKKNNCDDDDDNDNDNDNNDDSNYNDDDSNDNDYVDDNEKDGKDNEIDKDDDCWKVVNAINDEIFEIDINEDN